MAMESHLAELERKHQALEQEISEALTHPATDGLKVAENQAAQVARQGRDRADSGKKRLSTLSRQDWVIPAPRRTDAGRQQRFYRHSEAPSAFPPGAV